MVDMHSHILPGIDDGARDVNVSLRLVEKNLRDGVTTICLTPHFNFERQSVEEFLEQRQKSYEILKQAVDKKGWNVEFVLGAEVAFSTELAESEKLDKLCYLGTKCMLIELPAAYLPKWTSEVLDEIQLQGITPLLAHVERYTYFQNEPDKLYQFIEDGCYTQVNATSLVKHKNAQKFIALLMKHGMVHCMGSDTHSLEKRPPMLKEAANFVQRKMGKDYLDYLVQSGTALATAQKVKKMQARPIRSIFGYYF